MRRRKWDLQLLIKFLKMNELNTKIANRNKLVEKNLLLVKKVAHRMKHKCNLPFSDLEQIGAIGLIKAANKYRKCSGSFSSFAVPYIQGEILHYLRDKHSLVRVPRRIHDLCTAYQKISVEDESLICQKLSINSKELMEVKLAIENRYIVSIDSLTQEFCGCSREDYEDIDCLLDCLDKVERSAIVLHYFKGYNKRETAQKLKTSPNRIGKIINKAINKLKTQAQSAQSVCPSQQRA